MAVHAENNCILLTKAEKTALLGGHFIYNSTWETSSTPHSANVVQTVVKNGIDVSSDPTKWDYNVHIGANGIKLRNNELVLSEWTSTALKFNNPSTGTAQLIIGANGTLQSGNYERGSNNKFSSNGTKIDLINGDIITKYFRLSQGLESLNAGAYIHGTVEALDGRIGTGYTPVGGTETNYWEIGNYDDYNLHNTAKLIGHGSSFIQLGDDSTWRLATNRIHTGWYVNSDTVLHYPQIDGKYWDFGIHVPNSDSPAGRGSDKFIYVRSAKADSTSSTILTNLLYDIDDNYDTAQWDYKFWIDKDGKVHAQNFYIGNSTTPIGGGAGTIAEKLLNGAGSSTQPVYFRSDEGHVGEAAPINYTIGQSVPSDSVWIKNITTTGAGNAVTNVSFDSTTGTITANKGATYLTSYTETDPTVPSWAKASTKPSYSYNEITGTIPASALPSDINEILEYDSYSEFPITGAEGKIYVDTSTNKIYRWNGTTYTEFNSSLSLGETSTTAYRGDRGKIAYDHASAKGNAFASGLYKITTNSEGHVTAATAASKSDIGLGNVENKSSATIRGEITSDNIVDALTYTPYDASNPAGYITSAEVTDTKVTQTNTNDNAEYRVLFSENANDTTQTVGARKNTNFKYNPSTGAVTATTFIGSLTGTASGNLTSNSSLAWAKVTGADNLKAIENLSGTSGLLRKTATNTWELDTTNYLSSFTESDPIFTASAASGITSSDITNWNSKTSNTGTVTEVIAGAGLKVNTATSGGSITTTGTIGHINSITAKTAAEQSAKTLGFGDTFTLYEEKYDAQGHITGVASYNMTMPANPNTHYTANLVTGASVTAQANAAVSTNGNVFLNLIENSTVRNSHNIVGSGTVTVTSDANGKITINGSAHPTSLKNPNALTLNLFNETTTRATGRDTPTSSINYDGSIAGQTFEAAGKNAITNVSAEPGTGGATTFTFIKADGSSQNLQVTVTASVATGATQLTDGDGNPISTTGSTIPVWFNDGLPEDVDSIDFNLLPTGTGNNQVAIGSHTHGNITSDGDITATAPTIANGDQIIINDHSSSKITNGPTFDGATTTQYLTKAGTWGTPIGTTYTAGTGLNLNNGEFSIRLGYTTSGNNRKVQVDSSGNLYVAQKDTTYTAGTGLDLNNSNQFSIKLGYTTSDNNRAVQADSNGNLYVTQKDTWIPMQGATANANGTVGYVNAVPPKDGYNTKFLRADGTWVVPGGTYSLPLAANGTRGGIQIGYTTDVTNRNYAVNLSNEKAYVNVPWTDRYVNKANFEDDTTNTSNSPIKMTLTRAGSDTTAITANIPKVSSSSAGVVPKGTVVSSQSKSTKFLREDGTWATPSYTSNTDTATAADNILKGSNSGTEITYAPYTSKQDKLSFDTGVIAPSGTTRLNLNGYLYATKLYSNGKEVLTEHQSLSNYKTKQEAIAAPTKVTNKWVSTLAQNANGELTITYDSLDTSGTWSGEAGTAVKLTTARTIRTNLESTSAASFDGSNNISPGITGTLGIANGGTGATTAASARTQLGLGTAATYTASDSVGNNSNLPTGAAVQTYVTSSINGAIGNFLTYNVNEGISAKKIFAQGTSYGTVTNKTIFTEKANINYDATLDALVFSFI